MNYYAVKNNFLRGLWNLTMVKLAKKKGIINQEQFNDIVLSGMQAGIVTIEEYEEATGETFQ